MSGITQTLAAITVVVLTAVSLLFVHRGGVMSSNKKDKTVRRLPGRRPRAGRTGPLYSQTGLRPLRRPSTTALRPDTAIDADVSTTMRRMQLRWQEEAKLETIRRKTQIVEATEVFLKAKTSLIFTAAEEAAAFDHERAVRSKKRRTELAALELDHLAVCAELSRLRRELEYEEAVFEESIEASLRELRSQHRTEPEPTVEERFEQQVREAAQELMRDLEDAEDLVHQREFLFRLRRKLTAKYGSDGSKIYAQVLRDLGFEEGASYEQYGWSEDVPDA